MLFRGPKKKKTLQRPCTQIHVEEVVILCMLMDGDADGGETFLACGLFLRWTFDRCVWIS